MLGDRPRDHSCRTRFMLMFSFIPLFWDSDCFPVVCFWIEQILSAQRFSDKRGQEPGLLDQGDPDQHRGMG